MDSFEKQKNRKALAYTAMICVAIGLLCILVSWQTKPPVIPQVTDLIEVNLGNLDEGFGTEQPDIRGERSPYRENIPQANASSAPSSPDKVDPDDNADPDAAAVMPVKKPNPRTPNESPDEGRNTRPQTPRITYNGPNRQNGNNAEDDNSYRYQGNNPNGRGDAGSPDGNRDSYGNDPGGRIGGGVTVTKGNRKIVKSYSFTDELDRATVYAIIKVSPDGRGTWQGFDKGSSTRSESYKNAIINHLNKISFDKSDKESIVTVRFNFNVN